MMGCWKLWSPASVPEFKYSWLVNVRWQKETIVSVFYPHVLPTKYLITDFGASKKDYFHYWFICLFLQSIDSLLVVLSDQSSKAAFRQTLALHREDTAPSFIWMTHLTQQACQHTRSSKEVKPGSTFATTQCDVMCTLHQPSQLSLRKIKLLASW